MSKLPLLLSSLVSFAALAGCDSGGSGGGDGGTVDAPSGSVDAAPVALSGVWGRGGWLNGNGQVAAQSSMTLTLTGTTVGGEARINGTAPSVLTGTFDGARMMASFRSTSTYTLDLALTGGFLVGPYAGGIVDGIGTFVSDLAPPAPATMPTMLVGTWKSSKSAAMGAVTVTLVDTNPITGHINAVGLVDEDAQFGYNDRVIQGGTNITTTAVLLFGSGDRFVGSYGKGTDVGVLDLSFTP
jgi:hypothetical protein